MHLLVNWNVLCWNVRGLNSGDKQLALSNAITSSGCAVVCLQETKKSSFDLSFIKSCCPRRFDHFAFVPSRGASGGIITIWNSNLLKGKLISQSYYHITIEFTYNLDNSTWYLTDVYGPNYVEGK